MCKEELRGRRQPRGGEIAGSPSHQHNEFVLPSPGHSTKIFLHASTLAGWRDKHVGDSVCQVWRQRTAVPTSDVASVALNTFGDSDIVGPRAFTADMAYPAVGGVVSPIGALTRSDICVCQLTTSMVRSQTHSIASGKRVPRALICRIRCCTGPNLQFG